MKKKEEKLAELEKKIAELEKSLEAAKKMEKKVRVVSMPCMELFEKQSAEYKKSVLVDGVPILGVEAGAVHGG